MKNTMGVILTGGRNEKLGELTAMRSSAAVPIGGKYRLIDFALSNMVNSGITNIGVIAQYNIRSLMDHLGSGKEWDLDRKKNGLMIFPPHISGENSGWYRGTADALYNNITYLERSDEEYVLVAQGNCIYKMDFNELLEKHISTEADLTIVYRDMDDFNDDELEALGIIQLDKENRIIDFQEKPLKPYGRKGSTGIYILRRELLISLLEESYAHGDYDFVKDVIIKKLDQLNIRGFMFRGYWRNCNTLQMYYRCNMELLIPEIRHELYKENGRIYTKVKDETPAKYNEEAVVKNSIIADGCIIEGLVENSIIFRGVTVKKGAIIRNSIVMQGTIICENVELQYVILDKGVMIRKGKILKGEENWPIVVDKNKTI